jgi:hypothetical protein
MSSLEFYKLAGGMRTLKRKIKKNQQNMEAKQVPQAVQATPAQTPVPNVAQQVAHSIPESAQTVAQPNYAKMTSKELWSATKDLGPESLGNLSIKDKARALVGQAQSADWSPKGIGKAVWRNMGEAGGGGGYSAGSGTLARYLPMGAKLTVASMGVPMIASGLSKEDAEGKGRSRTERIAGGIGHTLGAAAGYLPHSVNRYLGVAALPASIGASILAGGLGQTAGEFVGKHLDRGVSKLRGVKSGDVMAQKFQQQQQQQAQRSPQARINSSGAM